MRMINEKSRRFAANSLFPTFFYVALGLVLAQVGAAQVHGSWDLHIFLAIPGITLLGLALYRARLHWSAATAGMPSLRARALGWYLLLFATGACVGVLASAGSVLLLGMVAALTYLLPWTKVPVCRAQFMVSSVFVLAGAVAWIVIYSRPAHSLYFMVAAWMLYVPAMFMHILVLMSLDRGYRICEPRLTDKPAMDVRVTVPSNQTRPQLQVCWRPHAYFCAGRGRPG